jgi:tRNA dimethylallyltransferase
VKPLVAIVGPTAVGKSALALVLAGRFDGEIVSADSRQVYRDLNVGTAKPTRQETDSIPHHLIDVADPSETFTLAQYLELADRAIVDIHGRSRLPLLVGGSGLYINALLKGMKPPQVSPDENLRRELEERASREGGEALHRELAEVDPEAAASIDPRNARRTIRALEVWMQTGSRFSEAGGESPPPYRSLMIGLTTSRSDLYQRIDERVDKMMESGLLQEVEALLGKGISLETPAMSGLGYRQIAEHVSGVVDLETAVKKIKTQTHRFARQQYTWFRLDDEQIRWFDVRDESYERDVADLISVWLNDEEP